MKNLFYIILITFSFVINAQVDYDKNILSNYAEFYILDYNANDYVIDVEGQFMKTLISPEAEYYVFSINDSEPSKIWWEYSGTEEGADVYYTSSDEKMIFDYENQLIWSFYNFNETTNYFEKLTVFSKLEVIEKN